MCKAKKPIFLQYFLNAILRYRKKIERENEMTITEAPHISKKKKEEKKR